MRRVAGASSDLPTSFAPSAARWRVGFTILLLLIAGHATGQPADDATAQNLLAHMSAALRALDYQGSFIYQHDGRIDALRIFHAGGMPERERLLSLSGVRSEIVRDGASVICQPGGLPTVLLPNRLAAHLLPLIPDTRGAGFARLYSLSVGGTDRIAGYPAQIIDIAARDGYRYGYRLWLDENSHLPLRSAVVDGARRPLEQFMFVTLDIGATPRQSDLAPSSAATSTAAAPEVPLGGPPQWRVADLPPGFYFMHSQRPAEGPTQAEHQIYTDGVANVSIYMEPRSGPSAPDRSLVRGALGIYSHDVGTWRITGLGDVPRATVERMARSVQPVAPGGGAR